MTLSLLQSEFLQALTESQYMASGNFTKMMFLEVKDEMREFIDHKNHYHYTVMIIDDTSLSGILPMYTHMMKKYYPTYKNKISTYNPQNQEYILKYNKIPVNIGTPCLYEYFPKNQTLFPYRERRVLIIQPDPVLVEFAAKLGAKAY